MIPLRTFFIPDDREALLRFANGKDCGNIPPQIIRAIVLHGSTDKFLSASYVLQHDWHPRFRRNAKTGFDNAEIGRRELLYSPERQIAKTEGLAGWRGYNQSRLTKLGAVQCPHVLDDKLARIFRETHHIESYDVEARSFEADGPSAFSAAKINCKRRDQNLHLSPADILLNCLHFWDGPGNLPFPFPIVQKFKR